jgi:multidrug efflux pump subunit AcrB
MPILVSTITTIIVFFPVLFLQGVARNVFLPLALTISFALIMSFFVSRTVTPLLCFYVLKSTAHAAKRGVAGAITRSLDRMDEAYARALSWVLGHRWWVIAVIVGLTGASCGLGKKIGTEFFPDSDEAQFTVVYKTPIGSRVERTEEVAARLEKTVAAALSPGGEKRFTTMLADNGLPSGRTALFTSNSGPHAGNLAVNLVPKSQRAFSDVAATEKVRAALGKDYPGTQVFFSTGGIVKRILSFGSAAPIDVEIVGYDLGDAAGYAKQLLPKLAAMADADGKPLLTDVQISREENYPELDIEVDREKAGTLGLTETQIAQSVLSSVVGNIDGVAGAARQSEMHTRATLEAAHAIGALVTTLLGR